MAGLAVAIHLSDRFVFSACSGEFTSSVEQLAVALHSSIELWQSDAEGQPELAKCIPMHTTLQRVLVVHPGAPSDLDWLLVLTSDNECLLLAWDSSARQWSKNTASISVTGDTVPRRVDQVCCSAAVCRSENTSRYVQWAVAAYEGVIHVLRVTLRDG